GVLFLAQRLLLLALGDVRAAADPLDDLAARVEHGHAAAQEGAILPVVAAQADLVLEEGPVADRLGPAGREARAVLGVDRLLPALGAGLVLGLAGEVTPARHLGVAAPRVGGPEDGRGAAHHRAVAVLARLQQRLALGQGHAHQVEAARQLGDLGRAG